MRRYLRAVVLVALASLPLMPAAYYGFFAYVRHEHFYRGLPTSYWELVLRQWNPDVACEPSEIPYFKDVLSYIGFRDAPSVLSGDREAIPLLMDLIWSKEPVVRSYACHSLAGIAVREAIISGISSIQIGGSGSATALGQGRDRVIMLSFASYSYEDFILIDSAARYLDTISCRFHPRCATDCPTFHTEAVEPTQFIIRYCPEVGQSDADPDPSQPIDRDVLHNQKCIRDLVTKPEWEADGLCRFAVRGDKFIVLRPDLTASTVQWRWRDEDMPR
jgi:hypothetical protein